MRGGKCLHQLRVQMRPWVNQGDGLGGRLSQDQDEFVQVFSLAAQGRQFDLAGEQSGQGAIVAVQIKSLPWDATLVKPARAGGGFDAFTHVSFGLHGQNQAMFYSFHISRLLNRYGLSVSVVVVCGAGADGFTVAGCAVAASLSQ
jgi:hypothetical protein